jgi:hypothetical protein
LRYAARWEETGESHQEVPSPDASVTILVVPTCLRVVYSTHYEHPEFEFEGWVLGPGERPWVRGALRTNDSADVEECTIYVLEPGQELGTRRTPGID